jgi:hypothetical protein
MTDYRREEFERVVPVPEGCWFDYAENTYHYDDTVVTGVLQTFFEKWKLWRTAITAAGIRSSDDPTPFTARTSGGKDLGCTIKGFYRDGKMFVEEIIFDEEA